MSKPRFLDWTEEFAVGHKMLDAEHRRLMEIINDIYNQEDAGQPLDELAALLHSMERIAVDHFRHENSVLRLELFAIIGTAAINEHMAEHAAALTDLQSIAIDLKRGALCHGHALSEKLKHWFIEHSTKYDADLKDSIQIVRNRSVDRC
jgi:hemerythrin-like metal-binding protein